jgi:spore maturation protein SpmB
MSCLLTPLSVFQSTNLNSKIDCFGRLGERIVRALGAPIITVEIHQDQLFENISLACEMYTKYAGYTKEYLVFDSRLYDARNGIRLDHLYTLANGNLTDQQKINNITLSPDVGANYSVPQTVYVVHYPVNGTVFSEVSGLSAVLSGGLTKNQLLDRALYATLTSNYGFHSFFTSSSTIYTTTTGYHSVNSPVPSSIFISNSALSSTFGTGLSTGRVLNDSNYSLLSSNISNFQISAFFTTSSAYAVINNDIPVSIFQANSALSSIFTEALSTYDIITDNAFVAISAKLSGFGVGYFFELSSAGEDYVTTTKILSNIFSSYDTVSALFTTDLNVNDVVVASAYNVLSSIGHFNLSSFMTNGYSMYVNTTPILSGMFTNNVVLSGEFPYGIIVGDILLSTDIPSQNNIFYGTLSSNFNNSLSAFLSAYSLSTLHIDVYHTLESSLPTLFLSAGTILNNSNYNNLSTNNYNVLTSFFTESYNSNASSCGSALAVDNTMYNNMFDYDLMTYRKVMDIESFTEGATTGINNLFTIEQTLAQQTYFSYAMGNYGFDLVSWYCVKDWLETREKMLATNRSIDFNPRTQIMRMTPAPTSNSTFYGVLACSIERPLADVIKEIWPYQYALALSKITVGMVRGKYQSVQMFGSQLFGQDLIAQGIAEKEKLETALFEGAAAGFGDGDFCGFLIG